MTHLTHDFRSLSVHPRCLKPLTSSAPVLRTLLRHPTHTLQLAPSDLTFPTLSIHAHCQPTRTAQLPPLSSLYLLLFNTRCLHRPVRSAYHRTPPHPSLEWRCETGLIRTSSNKPLPTHAQPLLDLGVQTSYISTVQVASRMKSTHPWLNRQFALRSTHTFALHSSESRPTCTAPLSTQPMSTPCSIDVCHTFFNLHQLHWEHRLSRWNRIDCGSAYCGIF